ncbi:hypothetical protein [Bacillus halotolerans]|uniref:hypothetical protein n=1 Tax=Bacillus halotolerans TaxID=260554 RepID=UPI000AD9CBE4|nr:hypothetical protein [Bacillus halotolerans]
MITKVKSSDDTIKDGMPEKAIDDLTEKIDEQLSNESMRKHDSKLIESIKV